MIKTIQYECNGFTFYSLADAIAYEGFMRKLTGIFYAIVEIKL